MKAEKRRTPPMAIKLQGALAQLEVLMRRLGMIPEEMVVSGWDFDHDPALELRAIDEATGKHTPHQHDVRFLVWRPRQQHRVKTTGRAGTSKLAMVNGDAQKIAKNRQRAKKQAERDAARAALPEPPPGRMKPKPPRRWPSRPLQSRNTFQDRRPR